MCVEGEEAFIVVFLMILGLEMPILYRMTWWVRDEDLKDFYYDAVSAEAPPLYHFLQRSRVLAFLDISSPWLSRYLLLLLSIS